MSCMLILEHRIIMTCWNFPLLYYFRKIFLLQSAQGMFKLFWTSGTVVYWHFQAFPKGYSTGPIHNDPFNTEMMATRGISFARPWLFDCSEMFSSQATNSFKATCQTLFPRTIAKPSHSGVHLGWGRSCSSDCPSWDFFRVCASDFSVVLDGN